MEPTEPTTSTGKELFFAYGSLLRETGNLQVDKAMAEAGDNLGRGFIGGRLYDLGEFPGALPAEGALPEATEGQVWGRLIALRDPAAFFAMMDDYEVFLPGQPRESEFIRSKTRIFLPDAATSYTGHVYFYNQSVAGKPIIPNGDYLAYRQAKESPR